jgi:O-antigen ligase
MNRIPILLKNRGITSWILALIAGFIFLNPFPHVTALKEISFYAAVGLICGSIALKRTSFRFTAPLTFPFLLIFLWASIGIFFAVDKANTIHDLYAHFIKYVAMYYLIVNIFDSRVRLNALAWTIILSTASFCIWGVSYFYLFLGHPIGHQLGVEVFKEIPTNIIGIVTVFGILLSLQMLSLESRTQHKIAIIFMLALMVLATLLTQTRSTFLALFCVLVILSLRNRRMLIVIVAIVMLISILPIKNRLTPSAILDKLGKDPRISISYTYIEVIKEFPVHGIGFGLQSYAEANFLKKYHDRVDPAKRTADIITAPHNFFIDILVRLGIIGLALYLYALYKAMMMIIKLSMEKADRNIRNWGFTLFCALVAFLIQGMFENVHSGPAAIVFYVQLAMITILWNMKRDERKATPRAEVSA